MAESVLGQAVGDVTTKPGPRRGPAQVLTTKVGLQLGANLPYDDWERAGHQLAGVLSSSSWWLGDWLIYGRENYEDRYERGAQVAGLRYQTLRNYAWVAGRFPAARRRAGLSFQHHAEVAALDVEQQESWLQRAEANAWSLKRLRSAIRETRRDSVPPVADAGNLRRLSIPGERFRLWHQAAVHSGIDVEQWVLATLDNAAEEILTA